MKAKKNSYVERVLRGGSFSYFTQDLSVSFRYRDEPEDRSRYVGFRCVVRRKS